LVQLPAQILRSLGFKAAVLKNPGTAWGGYTAGYDAEVVEWLGPDGSSIPAVAALRLRGLAPDVGNRVRNRIQRVCAKVRRQRHRASRWQLLPGSGMGGPAESERGAHPIRDLARVHVGCGCKPTKQWRFSQEDILTTLPWGERTLQTLAQQVRSAENRLLLAESWPRWPHSFKAQSTQRTSSAGRGTN